MYIPEYVHFFKEKDSVRRFINPTVLDGSENKQTINLRFAPMRGIYFLLKTGDRIFFFEK
jgi:hypothetical protein